MRYRLYEQQEVVTIGKWRPEHFWTGRHGTHPKDAPYATLTNAIGDALADMADSQGIISGLNVRYDASKSEEVSNIFTRVYLVKCRPSLQKITKMAASHYNANRDLVAATLASSLTESRTHGGAMLLEARRALNEVGLGLALGVAGVAGASALAYHLWNRHKWKKLEKDGTTVSKYNPDVIPDAAVKKVATALATIAVESWDARSVKGSIGQDKINKIKDVVISEIAKNSDDLARKSLGIAARSMNDHLYFLSESLTTQLPKGTPKSTEDEVEEIPDTDVGRVDFNLYDAPKEPDSVKERHLGKLYSSLLNVPKLSDPGYKGGKAFIVGYGDKGGAKVPVYKVSKLFGNSLKGALDAWSSGKAGDIAGDNLRKDTLSAFQAKWFNDLLAYINNESRGMDELAGHSRQEWRDAIGFAKASSAEIE